MSPNSRMDEFLEAIGATPADMASSITYVPQQQSMLHDVKTEWLPEGGVRITGTLSDKVKIGEPWVEFECPACQMDDDLKQQPIGSTHRCTCCDWEGPLDAKNAQMLVILENEAGDDSILVRVASWETP